MPPRISLLFSVTITSFAGVALAEDPGGPRIAVETATPTAEKTEDRISGYLGLSVISVGPGLTVSRVDEGSPAERSGIKAGDILVSVNGTPIGTKEHLALQLQKQQPGDTLDLEIMRGNTVHKVKATLGTRKAMLPPPPPSAARIDEGWQLYHNAFMAHVRRRRGLSMDLLEQLKSKHPEHPATSLSSDLVSAMKLSLKTMGDQPMEPVDPFGPEKPTLLARAELGAFQTISGIGIGIEFCGAVGFDDGRVITAVLAVGGGAGLTLSLILTNDGITPGSAHLINSLSGWGFWNGIGLAVATEADDESIFGTMLAAHLAGLGTGILLSHFTDLRSGDVSLASSTGIWAGLMTLFIHGIADSDDSRAVFGTMLLASDVGLLFGGWLGASGIYPMSRSRAMLIDAGGLLGMLLGMGTAVLIEGEVESQEGFFGSALGGTILGLGLATFLTRNWDLPEEAEGMSLAVVPTPEGGGMAVVGMRF